MITTIIATISLSVTAYQDFNYRAISWLLIPVLALILSFHTLNYIGLINLIVNTAANLSFLVINLLMLSAYYSLKECKLRLLLKKEIGLGDILFFLVLCPLFSPVNFIVFYLCSLTIILVATWIYSKCIRTLKSIPLAGGQALLLIPLLIIDQFVSPSFLISNWIVIL